MVSDESGVETTQKMVQLYWYHVNRQYDRATSQEQEP